MVGGVVLGPLMLWGCQESHSGLERSGQGLKALSAAANASDWKGIA